MRYLVTGAGGMLGTDLLAALAGRDVVGVTRADLDLLDLAAVTDAVAGIDAVVNCAAHTRVDDAETEEALALEANARIPEVLATACAAVGGTFVQLSTDYVFDGTQGAPYAEDAPIDPINAYGRTKAEGERRAVAANPGRTHIVRTSWLYGKHGVSFPRTMLRLAGERETVTVIDDQQGQPSWTADVALQLVRLLDSGVPSGTWHATNGGRTSWFGFARELFELSGLDPERVRPTSSAEFVRPAARPAFSVLGHSAWGAAGIPAPRAWQVALAEAVAAGTFSDQPE